MSLFFLVPKLGEDLNNVQNAELHFKELASSCKLMVIRIIH